MKSNKENNMERTIIIDKDGLMDGDQHTAHLDNFINLQESPCGFGDTKLKAVEHLLEQIEEIT
jgi:hypothetical protein